jgi:hypothetical protein
MTDADPLRRYKANLQGEVDGAAIYTALAESEKDPSWRRCSVSLPPWNRRMVLSGNAASAPKPVATCPHHRSAPASLPGWRAAAEMRAIKAG